LFLLQRCFAPRRKEKWQSSGAGDAFSRASASIPDATKQSLYNIFKREHLRGPAVFFGLGEERPFYVERNPSLLVERVRHNLSFFYLNYMLLTAVLFCLMLLTSPTTIIGLALLAGAWTWVIRSTQSGALALGGACVVCILTDSRDPMPSLD
jgi:hypothetical protein